MALMLFVGKIHLSKDSSLTRPFGQVFNFQITLLLSEINKLHGHAGDVVCLSVSNCGTWLASAAKGRDTKSSAILIWELKRY